jgi:hypothetical protein
MIAEIKSVLCADVEDLDEFVPDDPERFAITLQLLIGTRGEDGSESFEVTVVTPLWLMDNIPNGELYSGRHKFVMLSYNRRQIMTYFHKVVGNCSGNTWEEIARKLSRIGHWEFEDYKEFEDSTT